MIPTTTRFAIAREGGCLRRGLRVPENLAPFIPEILAGLVPNSSTN